MDVKQTKVSLVLKPAQVDGFSVHENWSDGTGVTPLFAGTLSHCLAFMESRMRPAEEICATEPGDAVSVDDVIRHDTDLRDLVEAAKAGLPPNHYLRAFTATPEAPGSVDSEWDGGAAAAFRAIGKAWREKQEQVPFKCPPKSNDDPRLSSIVRMLEDKGRASMAAYLSWVEVQVILAALRQQDAQNAGSIQKDFK